MKNYLLQNWLGWVIDNNVASSFLESISPSFCKPIFILSAPRAGSSYLFEIMRRMQGVASLKTENSPLWFRVFPYGETLSTISDYIGLEQFSPPKGKLMRGLIALKLLSKGEGINIYKNFIMGRNITGYVEKTISNCFHLSVIDKIFPDALYIYLIRDGRANVSSMIEAWNTYVKVGIPPLPKEASVRYWSFAMPPYWHNHLEKPIEEICAWSWVEHNKYVLNHFDQQPSSNRLMTLRYEDLLKEPRSIIGQISDFTELQVSDSVLNYVKSRQPSWSTISPPKKDKWKEVNFERINRIWPVIQPMMSNLGY